MLQEAAAVLSGCAVPLRYQCLHRGTEALRARTAGIWVQQKK